MYRDLSLYFIDILIAINKIQRYTKDIKSSNELTANEIIYDATIRELIIIGEAVNILIKSNFLSKDYRKIVDFRNMIVHGYFGIDEEILFMIIVNKLPELKEKLIDILRKNKINVKDVINETIKDFKNQKEVIKFLKNLKEII